MAGKLRVEGGPNDEVAGAEERRGTEAVELEGEGIEDDWWEGTKWLAGGAKLLLVGVGHLPDWLLPRMGDSAGC